jgi:hypothetical protein
MTDPHHPKHPHPNQPIQQLLSDDEIEIFSKLGQSVKHNPQLRLQVKGVIVATIAERIQHCCGKMPERAQLNKIGEFAEAFIVASQKPENLRKEFDTGGSLHSQLKEILGGTAIPLSALNFADRLRAELVALAKHWTHTAERILKELDPNYETREEKEKRGLVTSATRRSSDAAVTALTTLPSLLGGSKLVSFILGEALSQYLREATEGKKDDEKLQAQRKGQIERLFPDPYKIPSEVTSDMDHLGELTLEQYATIYDRAVMVALRVREEQQAEVKKRSDEAGLEALLEMVRR